MGLANFPSQKWPTDSTDEAFKLYPHGPHGMGLAHNQKGNVSRWTDELLDWLSSVMNMSVHGGIARTITAGKGDSTKLSH